MLDTSFFFVWYSLMFPSLMYDSPLPSHLSVFSSLKNYLSLPIIRNWMKLSPCGIRLFDVQPAVFFFYSNFSRFFHSFFPCFIPFPSHFCRWMTYVIRASIFRACACACDHHPTTHTHAVCPFSFPMTFV
ncbi:hypothetical protein, unlikely [Trypanosoma congolense IL3000]|uniref:Uncharacterized protein n=1 Tax=Trypanosoma congolense (strain IL3000) TaxID=1068625 RepID=F9WC42_TRYCI|nr:hypothetical protein, unlikely [Trypanosoma congolense IL3000]